MDHLLRGLAPISQAGWEEIESEASRTLRHFLAGRKLLDYSASGGWQRGAVDLGRIDPVQDGSVRLANRTSAPMTEVRVDFVVSRDELAAVDRGAEDMDTQPVIDAARSAALAEDDAVFVGNSEAGIRGIGRPHRTRRSRSTSPWTGSRTAWPRPSICWPTRGSADRTGSGWGPGAGRV